MTDGERVLAALASEWADVEPLIDRTERATLISHMRRLRELADDSHAKEVACERAARFLLDSLPVGIARRLAEAGTAGRWADTPVDTFAGFASMDLVALILDPHPLVGPFLGPIRDRLLSAPALRGPRVDALASTAGLIRLYTLGGEVRIPAFQLRDVHTPWPVVRDVNAILDAERDPWGVADWWLSANAHLGRIPAELVGGGHDAEIVQVARYLVEGE